MMESKIMTEAVAAIRPVPQIGDDSDVIMSFYDWARLAGISERQAKRLRQNGQAPRCVLIGERKLGVTLAEHRRWTKARMERA
jgi:hypothetical protein